MLASTTAPLILPILFTPYTIITPLLFFRYSSTSLVRGFWDEIFWPSKPRTTKEPRTKESHIKVDIASAGYLVVLDTEQIN